jgi:hypothetical protein
MAQHTLVNFMISVLVTLALAEGPSLLALTTFFAYAANNALLLSPSQ